VRPGIPAGAGNGCLTFSANLPYNPTRYVQTDDTILCFRCHYDLRGVADDQPCPECGLLAGRSRRATDELREARPVWLRSLSRGIWLVLIALVLAIGWPLVLNNLPEAINEKLFNLAIRITGSPNGPYYLRPIVAAGGEIAAVLLVGIGCFLSTRAEGYEPADQLDRKRRAVIRILGFVPLLFGGWLTMLVLAESGLANWSPRIFRIPWVPIGLVFIASLLPVAAFAQLRSLARRAGSSHLMEHCTIVGVGTSLTLLAITGFSILQAAGYMQDMRRSRIEPAAVLLVTTSTLLFWLWSLYLMIRFAISFGRASRESRRAWRAADRSQSSA